jgi:uncharacterized protein (TIGR00251 family)
VTDEQASQHLTCGRYETDGSMVIDVRVQTRSSRIEVGTVENGRLKLRLTAPPVDDKANRQVTRLLAKTFGVAPSRVELLRGRTSRNKSFRVSGATLLPPITLAGDDAKGSDES